MTHWLKSLKNLKAVRPDPGFALRSKGIILQTNKRPRYQSLITSQLKQIFTLGLAMTMAIVLLFVLSSVSRFHLKGLSPELVASLNKKELSSEKDQLNFNIQLAGAKYYKESTNQVTMAIDNVFTSNGRILDTEGIRKQAQNIDSLVKELTL